LGGAELSSNAKANHGVKTLQFAPEKHALLVQEEPVPESHQAALLRHLGHLYSVQLASNRHFNFMEEAAFLDAFLNSRFFGFCQEIAFNVAACDDAHLYRFLGVGDHIIDYHGHIKGGTLGSGQIRLQLIFQFHSRMKCLLPLALRTGKPFRNYRIQLHYFNKDDACARKRQQVVYNLGNTVITGKAG
jgi:hypothetical protein